MTDNTELIALRKLAEAAPRFKDWKVMPARQDEGYAESYSIFMEGYGALGYWKGGKSHHTDADWLLTKESAEFICAANPSTIVTLLDALEAAQAEVDKLVTALAACRDAFSTPVPGSDLDGWYVSAIADPLGVPDYIKACAAGASPQPVQPSQARELSDDEIQNIYSKTHNEGFNGRNLETAFARAIIAAINAKGATT